MPRGTCLRNIDAGGGYGTVFGRDSDGGDQWEVFVEYTGAEIEADFTRLGGKKRKGKWFKDKKADMKGIKWDDGEIWEKQEYKFMATPNEIEETMQVERNAIDAETEAAAAKAKR